MLKGGLKSTGGYEGMYGDIVTIKPDITKTSKTWDEVKEEKKYNKKIISAKRTPHVEKDNVMGKNVVLVRNGNLWRNIINLNHNGINYVMIVRIV